MKKLFYSVLTGMMMCFAMMGFARAQHTFTFDPADGSEVDEGTEIQISVTPTASEIVFQVFATMEEAENTEPTWLRSVYGMDGSPKITAETPVLKVGVRSGTSYDVAYATYKVIDKVPHLKFDLSKNEWEQYLYGRYNPFKVELTYLDQKQTEFELYYCQECSSAPKKEKYDPSQDPGTGADVDPEDAPSAIRKVVATDGYAEIMIEQGMAGYFQAVAYFQAEEDGKETELQSELFSGELTAVFVETPSFDTATREVEKNTIVKIKDNEQDGGCTIFYSNDGETMPLKSLYEKQDPHVFQYNSEDGIKITEDVTLWAMAFKEKDGVMSGSERLRGRFTILRPTVNVQIAETYTIGEEHPTITVEVPEDFTLGTNSGDMALDLYIYSSDPTAGWRQYITQNGTKLDMAKADENNHEDSWTIECKLVKGDDFTQDFEGFVSVTPMLYIQIEKNGEKPEPPVASVPSGTVDKGTEVELSCPTEGADIYYTTGPEFPNQRYTTPFIINSDISIRTEARKDGITSDLVVFTYKIPEPPLTVEATVTPAPGEILAGTEIEIALSEPNVNMDITGYKLYPTVEAANEDITFNNTCSYYPSEGKPVPTVENPVLRVGVYKEVNRKWKYFDFVYIIKKDLSMPVITPAGGEVAICTEVEIEHAEGVQGAKIYYTLNDSVPEVGKDYTQEYTQKIKITEAVTIKAMAFKAKTGAFDRDSVSNVTVAVFTVLPLDTVKAPTFSIVFDEVTKGTKVTLSSATPEAVIYYTLNEEDPTKESILYDEQVEINEDVTIKAIATKECMANSKVSVKNYTIKLTQTPTFSVPAGEVEKGTKVALACATEGAKIYYTVNGEEPTAESTEYTAEIAIDSAMTIKAIAVKEDMKNSEVAEAAYTVKAVSNQGHELAGVSIYPNPTDGEFTVVAPVNAEVEIFNAVGVIVKRMVVAEGDAQLRLDNSGIYFVRVRANGQVAIKKVVVR